MSHFNEQHVHGGTSQTIEVGFQALVTTLVFNPLLINSHKPQIGISTI
jgi:hypothetical protein